MSKDNHIAKSPKGKKAYDKPRLTEYGDVREFTRGPGGSQKDLKGGLGHSSTAG